jgi:hypothetical protein
LGSAANHESDRPDSANEDNLCAAGQRELGQAPAALQAGRPPTFLDGDVLGRLDPKRAGTIDAIHPADAGDLLHVEEGASVRPW